MVVPRPSPSQLLPTKPLNLSQSVKLSSDLMIGFKDSLEEMIVNFLDFVRIAIGITSFMKYLLIIPVLLIPFHSYVYLFHYWNRRVKWKQNKNPSKLSMTQRVFWLQFKLGGFLVHVLIAVIIIVIDLAIFAFLDAWHKKSRSGQRFDFNGTIEIDLDMNNENTKTLNWDMRFFSKKGYNFTLPIYTCAPNPQPPESDWFLISFLAFLYIVLASGYFLEPYLVKKASLSIAKKFYGRKWLRKHKTVLSPFQLSVKKFGAYYSRISKPKKAQGKPK